MTLEKKLVVAAIAVATILGTAGGTLLNTMQARAADTTANPSQNTQTPPPGGQIDPSKGGHVGSNGVKETLLTGDTAEKVKAAALAAVSGGSIERVETDAEGAAYEAHMTKSDGTHVTVKLDSSFKVTATESGHGSPK